MIPRCLRRGDSFFTLNNPVKKNFGFCGRDEDGNYSGDGIYTFELLLDDKVVTRLLGVFKNGFCLDDFDCSNSIWHHDLDDPLFDVNCD